MIIEKAFLFILIVFIVDGIIKDFIDLFDWLKGAISGKVQN